MKLKALLTLAIASLCSVQGAWARVAPTFPEPQTLESGKTYYLYNVGSQRLVYKDNGYARASETQSTGVTITLKDNGCYTLQFSDNNYYWYMSSSGSSEMYSYSNLSDACYFRIAETEGGYTIQRNDNYNEKHFVANNSDYYVYANQTEGNIVWQLFDERAPRYFAKKALYDALETLESSNYDFVIDDYEAIYENEASTNDQLNNAAKEINNCVKWANRLMLADSEFPVFLKTVGNASWYYDSSTDAYNYTTIKNATGGLSATVVVDQDATMTYDYQLSSYSLYNFKVYLDGELYQQISNYEGEDADQRYFVELSPGKHTVEWVAMSTDESYSTHFYLRNIKVWKMPTITVNLTQAGSLGTEILYNVEHVKDVRKIVIKGEMNSDDWERVNMMTGVFEIDLTDANVTSLPAVKPGSYFHKIKLPKTLTSIQDNALSNTCLDAITFPETLTNIGKYAFQYSRIKDVVLPDAVISVGENAFSYNQSLENVEWSPNATVIPSYCFFYDQNIRTFDMPEGVTGIHSSAFSYDNYCKFQIPTSIKSIGADAFYKACFADVLRIPQGASVGTSAFNSCNNLKYVEVGEDVSFRSSNYFSTFSSCKSLAEIVFPTSFYAIDYPGGMLSSCSALRRVTFKSPTMVTGDRYNSFFDGCGSNITIRVPQYLVNAYKLDKYWYNYTVEGFSTADITDWNIKSALTLYSQDRFEGTPNITISTGGSWTINGELAQNIGDLHTNYSSQQYGGDMSNSAKILTNCDNVSINGAYRHSYYAYNNISGSPYYGRWHFICLPFDIKVNEITCGNDALFAIRYYDGASRAANGTGGNWKDYASDSVIPAGTGFIIQVSKDCWIDFHSLDNASKQNAVSNKIFVKALEANNSEQSSNKGWNLVGNPWLSYYNIHKLNFTAPITVYDGYAKKYSAYSVIDDDYAIRPNQAFFVQCPDEVNSIQFPVDGRQVTSVIESQNAARAEDASERKLIDVVLCSASNTEETEGDGEQCDKTRFVLNPQASIDYETLRDASKFMETGTSCPQIYTIENGEALAINERPIGDGTVRLGIIIPQDGTYTISAPRCQFQNIVLVDNETGIETDLTTDGSYTFTADDGTNDNRFMLRVGGTVITSVSEKLIVNSEEFATAPCYNLQGQRIAVGAGPVPARQKGVYIVNGKKVLK